MKKILFSLSLIGAFASFGATSEIDASEQVFGVLPITSSDASVIVAVPWVKATNTAAENIPVAEIIKTDNLTVGDWVRVWDDANKVFKVWNLQEVAGVKTWVPGNTVTAAGVREGSNAGDVTLARGDALVLHRTNPGTSSTPATFYVCGRYVTTEADSVTCAKATVDVKKAFTLIAPPLTKETGINAITWSNVGQGSTPNEGDYLTTPKGRLYYNGTSWVAQGPKTKKNPSGTWTVSTEKIKAGTGLWYTSVVPSGAAPVVTWPTAE